MPSRYVYISLLVLCAPLLVCVVASFTSLAIVTSAFALVVISIRLAFLAFEFSCGVAYDIVGWSAKNFICKLAFGSNPSSSTKIKDSNISSSNKHYEKKHKNHNSSSHSNHTYHKNNSIKPLSKHSPKSPKSSKIPIWDVDTYDDFGDKDFVSNDEYFTTKSTITNKRPEGRRLRSDYL
ncbi:hypothetical protein C2G38_2195620 [Gigaspora rosea]|uniref:Uncharacterized protein n=1 Tax=Gigaspora rosea TaxID=44941 RepID=A0A397UY18_9GLOM|nr:hypothetical protein C2G38_2195620 [Gigaspora rosea]